jgi:hypothetical protein
MKPNKWQRKINGSNRNNRDRDPLDRKKQRRVSPYNRNEHRKEINGNDYYDHDEE